MEVTNRSVRCLTYRFIHIVYLGDTYLPLNVKESFQIVSVERLYVLSNIPMVYRYHGAPAVRSRVHLPLAALSLGSLPF